MGFRPGCARIEASPLGVCRSHLGIRGRATTVAPALSIREKICVQGDRGAIIPLSCKGFGPAGLWALKRHFVCSTRATATTN